MTAAAIHDPKDIKTFLLAGRAIVTLVSQRTEARYTYRVSVAKDDDQKWFVGVLTGPDNESSYSYLGMITGETFRLTKASKFAPDSLPVRAFNFFFKHAIREVAAPELDVMHAGLCGRCGQTLTVPSSIASGLGPICAGKVGL